MGMWEIGDLCKNKTKKEGNLIDVFRENENIGIYVWEWESAVCQHEILKETLIFGNRLWLLLRSSQT
jgi:hypothetical protein